MRKHLVAGVLVRLGLFGLLWLVITEGRPGSWVVGLVFVAAATWLSLALPSPRGGGCGPWACCALSLTLPGTPCEEG